MYAEVKSNVGDISKPKQFVVDSGNPMVILRDVPALDFYDLYLPPDDDDTDIDDHCIPVFFGPVSQENSVVIKLLMDGPNSAWWDTKMSKWDFARTVCSWDSEVLSEMEQVSESIESAVTLSRSARFEFGENGQ